MPFQLDDTAAVPLWLPEPRDSDAILAFTTRLGGVSDPPYHSLNLGRSTDDDRTAVEENRRRVLSAAGLDPDRLATAGQVHGTAIAIVSEPGLHPATDALLTRTRGVALAVTAADCLPLLFTAPGAVAAVHSGWRGTADGAPVAALDALCELAGCAPARVAVTLGPSIRVCCYEVGPEVAARFPTSVLEQRDGRNHLDLVAAARLQLVAAGVPDGAIEAVPACTACDPARYFSHRRDGARTGRHWAIAALRGTMGGVRTARLV